MLHPELCNVAACDGQCCSCHEERTNETEPPVRKRLNVSVTSEAPLNFQGASQPRSSRARTAKPDSCIPRPAVCESSRGMRSTLQEIFMKGMARALLVGGFIMTAQAAMADTPAIPGSSDDAGISLTARATYADMHAADRAADVGSAFAGNAPDGVFLPARDTYAATRASNGGMAVISAFPGESDDAGVHLIARQTYADTHLAHAPLAQPAEAGPGN
jgi:hypothetical protein